MPFLFPISQMCCDCCLLGLMSASMGNGCELAPDLGKQCQHNKPAAGAQGNLVVQQCLPNGAPEPKVSQS